RDVCRKRFRPHAGVAEHVSPGGWLRAVKRIGLGHATGAGLGGSGLNAPQARHPFLCPQFLQPCLHPFLSLLHGVGRSAGAKILSYVEPMSAPENPESGDVEVWTKQVVAMGR